MKTVGGYPVKGSRRVREPKPFSPDPRKFGLYPELSSVPNAKPKQTLTHIKQGDAA